MYRIAATILMVGILLMLTITPSFADKDYDDHKKDSSHDEKDHKDDARHDKKHHIFNDQLNSKQCQTDHAKKIIDVKQKILNSVDSGVAGNNWAQDDYYRHIDVWQLGDSSFCAILKYEGSFVTFAGPSPNGTGTIDAGIDGHFRGGYRTTNFTAIFDPSVAAHGDIGVFDYRCDVSGNCPGFVDWSSLYFKDISGFDLAWWGWQYHAEKHGSWVNSIDGNFGDIT